MGSITTAPSFFRVRIACSITASVPASLPMKSRAMPMRAPLSEPVLRYFV